MTRTTDIRSHNGEGDPWASAKAIIGDRRVTLGPTASQQWLHAPDHLAMVLARYRVAAALIGDATDIVELGCGEGIGSRILINGRAVYYGVDNDSDALDVARGLYGADDVQFRLGDVAGCLTLARGAWDAVIGLDVIEHISAEDEEAFMENARGLLTDTGVCVIGTPSKHAEAYASPQSRAGHCNLYTPERLHALMGRYFHRIQDFGMNAVELHTGHDAMRHYLICVGIGPRSA